MKTTLSYFFIFLTFFSSFLSCTSDRVETPQSEKLNFNIKQDSEKIVNSISLIEADMSKSKSPLPTNIDQGTLDYYAGIVGLDPGSVSIELVNEVLNGIFITNDEGFSVLMDQYNYDNATKQIMLDIVNNGWVEEIETTNGFQELDSSDQEFILLANTVSMDLNPERNPNPGTAVGAMVGIIAGGACCGPIGAVIGAIVGGIAGSGVSDD